jgi:hypothetical protein
MARPRAKKLAKGDRLTLYISDLIDEEILDFINNQTELTSTFMMGIIKLYQDNGNVDLADYLPRKYTAKAISPQLLETTPSIKIQEEKGIEVVKKVSEVDEVNEVQPQEDVKEVRVEEPAAPSEVGPPSTNMFNFAKALNKQ